MLNLRSRKCAKVPVSNSSNVVGTGYSSSYQISAVFSRKSGTYTDACVVIPLGMGCVPIEPPKKSSCGVLAITGKFCWQKVTCLHSCRIRLSFEVTLQLVDFFVRLLHQVSFTGLEILVGPDRVINDLAEVCVRHALDDDSLSLFAIAVESSGSLEPCCGNCYYCSLTAYLNTESAGSCNTTSKKLTLSERHEISNTWWK